MRGLASAKRILTNNVLPPCPSPGGFSGAARRAECFLMVKSGIVQAHATAHSQISINIILSFWTFFIGTAALACLIN